MTEKQKAFIREYLVDFNATKAAIRAGYSENAASEQGYDNLRNPQIKHEIDVYIQENVLNVNEILRDNIEFLKNTIKTSKSDRDKLKASELLGKSIGQFSDKVILSGDEEKPIRVKIDRASNKVSK